LIEKVRVLDENATALAERMASSTGPARKAVEAELSAAKAKLVDTLEDMRLSKKTIDMIVKALTAIIRKVEKADSSDLMALERKAFCELVAHPKSQERIMAMMSTGKPLRN
jgi:hypothetical protein